LAPRVPELLDELLAGIGATVYRVGVAPDKDGLAPASGNVTIVSSQHVQQGGVDLLRIMLGDGCVFEAPTIGRHNAGNIACAVAAARWTGMDDNEIRAGLLEAQLPSMRLERMNITGVEVFNDAYNASPESMTAAITTFAELSAGAQRRILVLGDMLELGDGSLKAHREVIARALAESAIDRILLIGPLMAAAAEQAPDDPRISTSTDPTDSAIASIASELSDGDSVLLKGSRLMRLERVVDELKRRISREGSAQPRG
jgi:UDP-N-acetylmuramoyl-tripeptide--D-alanyl-D-alanine ligase